jgi:Dockerin type I domain
MCFKHSVRIIACAALLVLAANITSHCQPGDCNGNGFVTIDDEIMLINWLFMAGPQPAMPDCDCDGFPGLNYGDALQLLGSIFQGQPLFPYPGFDVPVPSLAKFYYNTQIPENANNFTVNIYVDIPPGFDISSLILPFSFAQQPGTMQAPVTCNAISFAGTVGNPIFLSSSIDNANNYFVILGNGVMAPGPTLAGGTAGLLCSVDFSSGAGTSNPITMTATDRIWPMLFIQDYYPNVIGQRVYLPEAIRAPYGDVNTDGTVNVSDAVYIINYVFVGGPPPGDAEPPE